MSDAFLENICNMKGTIDKYYIQKLRGKIYEERNELGTMGVMQYSGLCPVPLQHYTIML